MNVNSVKKSNEARTITLLKSNINRDPNIFLTEIGFLPKLKNNLSKILKRVMDNPKIPIIRKINPISSEKIPIKNTERMRKNKREYRVII